MANYTVDPNDEKLLDAKAEGDEVLSEYETSMNSAINANNAARDEALGMLGVDANGKVVEGSATDRLIDSQNKQTDFTIETIEQQKQQAEKDYIKEQSGAYKDWQKQSAKHGVNAEQKAAQGLQNSGYAESSQVAYYNQYQQRITAAREAFVQIKADYDNAMTQARLQNDSATAQIIADAMAKRLEIVTQFAFQNTELLTTLAQQKVAIRQQNTQNYLAVYNQLLGEKQLEESARQHNETLAENKRQFNKNFGLEQAKFNYQKAQASASKIYKGSSGTKKSNDAYVSKVSNAVIGKKQPEKSETSEASIKDAEAYLDALISNGATKNDVAHAISMALRDKAITTEQATELRNKYTPRGLQF